MWIVDVEIMKIVLIPGMGCHPVKSSNWYSWFASEIKKRPSVECILTDFPDPYNCRESKWVPFLTEEIGLDEETIIVGHSTGAACAMRILENPQIPKLLGTVLVAAAHTDLGDESERLSEYFNRPWDWESMKSGAKKIVCFHGEDDHLIPVHEARFIADKMKGNTFEYIEMQGKSHFFYPWNDLLDVVDTMIVGDNKE